MNPVKHSTELLQGTLEMGKLVSSRHVSYGLLLKISGRYCLSLRPRTFSNDVREAKELGKTKMTYIRGSIHEKLAKKEKKFSNSSSAEKSLKRSGKSNYRSSWEESIQRLEKSTVPESGHSSFQASANSCTKGDISSAAIKESKLGSSMPIADLKERATQLESEVTSFEMCIHIVFY